MVLMLHLASHLVDPSHRAPTLSLIHQLAHQPLQPVTKLPHLSMHQLPPPLRALLQAIRLVDLA